MSKNLEIKESLLEGAAESQRQNGLMPTVQKNEEIIVNVLEKVDKEPSRPKPSKPEQGPADKIGEWEHTKTPIIDEPGPKPRPLTMLEKKLIIERKLLGKRVVQLRSKPEWKKKVESIVALMMVAGTPEQHQFARNKLEQLIEKSNQTFGDWRKMPVQKLYFDGVKK